MVEVPKLIGLPTPPENRRRVLTGMRTTGELHLGHFVGALKEWKRIQDEGSHESFFLLADVQALTTHADNPAMLTRSVRDVVMDWLSVGLDPQLDRIHFVQQSQIPERVELSQAFMMIARFNEVMRNPTLKSELKALRTDGKNDANEDVDPESADMMDTGSATMGFMSYPVDQAADIYMVSPTPPQDRDELLVPVGEDQVPHLEYSRVLARRFNKDYGEVFVPCSALVGEVGRLVGTDGKEKMSKSLGNAISLSDDRETVNAKVRRMFTDPNRKRATDPGETENNPVFVYLRAFDSNVAEVQQLTEDYQNGRVGDVAVKQILAQRLNEFLDPIRDRRAQFEGANIRDMVMEGTQVARASAIPVVESVREKMHLTYPI